MTEIPRPNFIHIPDSSKSFTPPHTPDRITVQKRVGSGPSTPPDSPSRHSLPQPDKKALKTLLSLTRSIDNTVERLYSFCEHYFNEKLSSLMVDYFKKHFTAFEELNKLISSQNQLSQSLTESKKIPSSSLFQLNLGCVEEDWPDSVSDSWIDIASYYIKGPSDLASSTKRESIPLEERLSNADQKRKTIENARRLEIRKHTNRVRRVAEKREQQNKEAETAIRVKLDAADQRREEFLNQKKEKARNETEKAQETKYMVQLEAEGKKAQLTRKSDEIFQRHQQMVRDSQEKARERTLVKSPPRVLQARRKMAVKKGSLSLSEALSAGQLPGDITLEDLGGDQQEIELPDIKEPKESLNPHANDIVMKIEKNPTDSKTTSNFLKTLNDYRYCINSRSRAGNALVHSIKELIKNNVHGSDTIIHHCIAIADHSLPFSLHVAVECLSVFPFLCKHVNSLSCVKELIALCTKVSQKSNPSVIREFMIDHLASSVAIDSVCFLLSACSVDDLKDKSLSALIQSIISLIQSMADLYYEGKGDKQQGIACTVRAIGPSTIMFLAAMSVNIQKAPHELISAATIALSYLIVALPPCVEGMIDEQTAANINSVMRSFLKSSDPSQAGRHLIVLFGLLCKQSSIIKESCVWPPEPSVLQLLCALPLEFFIKKDGAAVLLPTIAAACYGNTANTKYVKKTINMTLLTKFLLRATPNQDSIASIQYRISPEDVKPLVDTLNKEDDASSTSSLNSI